MRKRALAVLALTLVFATSACSPPQSNSYVSSSTPTSTSVPTSSESIASNNETANPVVSATAGLPQVVTGVGGEEIALTKPQDRAALLTVDFQGTGRFRVQSLDGAKQPTATLIDVVGPNHAVVPLDHPAGSTAYLSVLGDGKWTIALNELSSARQVGTSFAGTGDDFVRYVGRTGVASAQALAAKGTFQVVYFSEGPETLFDSAQPFAGQHPIAPGPAYIQITASGRWTFTVK